MNIERSIFSLFRASGISYEVRVSGVRRQRLFEVGIRNGEKEAGKLEGGRRKH
jgi:hypothetical protein